MIIVFIIFLYERIRYRTKYEHKIRVITENIKNANIYGAIKYDKKEEEPFVDRLYKAVEDLRNRLRAKNRILQAVLDLVNTLALNIETERLVDMVLSRLIRRN